MADRAEPELTTGPDSSIKAEIPLSAEAGPTPEISEAMLDVHPPHESVHTWKDFFIHIATIVIGLLIAVGLEQAVEAIHHRHQLHAAEDSLNDEAVTNRSIIQGNLVHIAAARRAIQQNMVLLDPESASPESPVAQFQPYVPDTYLFIITDAAWLSLRDNGLLSLVPQPVSFRYWKIDYIHHLVVDDNQNIMRRREEVEALVHLHQDPARLSIGERERLFVAFSELDQALVQMRGSLVIFNAANELALSGKTLSESEMNEYTK